MSGDTVTQIDITKLILDTTNTLCTNMLESIDSAIYPLLDKTIFINQEIAEDSYFERIFGASPTSGVLMLANCLLFAFILYYCIRLITAYFSGAEVEPPNRFFLRAILAAIFVNSSLEICKLLINATNQISTFFCELGKDIFRKDISFLSLISSLSTSSSR
ncbi:MAG: hypothetical protein IJ220_00375 [Clostridia bacterium]|nr:hypothetical protein [Clostridia bacterium]